MYFLRKEGKGAEIDFEFEVFPRTGEEAALALELMFAGENEDVVLVSEFVLQSDSLGFFNGVSFTISVDS